MHLTKSQLRELTGTAQAIRQMAWLDQHGWVYATDCKGWPKVATAYYERRMGIRDDAAAGGCTAPDWSSFGLPANTAKA